MAGTIPIMRKDSWFQNCYRGMEGVAEIDSDAEEFKDKNSPDTTYYYVVYAYKGESYSEASIWLELIQRELLKFRCRSNYRIGCT